MIQIDLEIPKCCDECKFVYDSCKCIITGSHIDWDKSDSERLLDCPLDKIAEPKIDVLNKIRAEIQENINYNKKMNYQGIVAGLLLTLDIIDKYRNEVNE